MTLGILSCSPYRVFSRYRIVCSRKIVQLVHLLLPWLTSSLLSRILMWCEVEILMLKYFSQGSRWRESCDRLLMLRRSTVESRNMNKGGLSLHQMKMHMWLATVSSIFFGSFHHLQFLHLVAQPCWKLIVRCTQFPFKNLK
ncbi:hypothetical protein Taro_018790 [Colocasia esculenta]|uniref:Uncharacterized protein n=1 Tax=Colocasia esculenta TaxID=4460 RepID=A0A843USA5_COLES|nr:hypothetical protein [Colocasia esculenta]